eukprot:4212904-Ditylum_brightwellii.AAC.1
MSANKTVAVNTVENNKSKYISQDYSHALLARKIQDRIRRPILCTYVHLVDNNLLPYCPITRTDILAAEDTWHPYVGCLQGRTVCHPGLHTRSVTLGIPMHIFEKHMEI